MKHNQTLHILDEHGRSYCQMENVERKRGLEWVPFEETGGRSVCKNCLALKDGDPLTSEFKAVMAG